MAPANSVDSPQRVGRWWRWWLVGYAALVAAIVVTMIWLRQSAVPQLSSQKSIDDWQAWKQANAEEQKARSGPVERRVPKSDEPPELVLMRDFFGVLMTGALLFSSLLYWIMAWFVTGILRSRINTPSPSGTGPG
jgi:uncharacterized membrane protein (DUF485 family)